MQNSRERPPGVDVGRRAGRIGLAAVLGLASPAGALTINLFYDSGNSNNPGIDPNASGLTDILLYVASYYEDIILDSHTLDLTFWYEAPGGASIADHSPTGFSGGRETSGDLRFDPTVNWFIDPTPAADLEFTMQQTLWQGLTGTQQSDWYNGGVGLSPTFEAGFGGGATATGGANGTSDLLSTALHEIGHALGMSASNDTTVSQTNDGDYDFNPSFINGVTGFAVETANNSGDDNLNIAHLESGVALMNPNIPNSTRVRPSHTDLLAMASGGLWSMLDLPRRELYESGSWGDARHWSGNRAPGADDDAFFRVINGVAALNNPGFANNLQLSNGVNLSTNAHKLDLSNRLTATGPGTLMTVSSGGELEAVQIDIQNSAELSMTGGVVDAAILTIDAGTNLTSLLGTNHVQVSGSLVNNGTIRALVGSTLVLNSAAANPWNLDGAESGEVEALSGNIIIDTGGLQGAFRGNMRIGAGRFIRIDAPWTNEDDIALFGGTDFANRARLIGGTVHHRTLDAWIRAEGLVDIDAPLIVEAGLVEARADAELNLNGVTELISGELRVGTNATLDVNGSLTVVGDTAGVGLTINTPAPGSSGGVTFDGPTTYTGGAIDLSGVLRQNGNAAVTGTTTVTGGWLDLDGAGEAAVWTVDAPLTLVEMERLENSTVSNTFNGEMTVNNAGSPLGGGGVLDVGFDARGGTWTMAGKMTLDGSVPGTFPFITIIPTMLDGADINITGQFIVKDRAAVGARATFSSLVSVSNTGSRLVLAGGDLAAPNRLAGGTFGGLGVLAAADGHALHGFGNIAIPVDFAGTAELRADDGQLNLANTILEVGVIGTANVDGVLNVNNAWNANVADKLELLGGSLTGATVFNGTVLDPGLITGHGTLAPHQVVNDGVIAASGGTLVIDTTLNPDLDGGGNGGVIEALLGDLTVADPVTDLFDGVARVGANRMLRFDGGWTLSGNGTLSFFGGATPTAAARVAGQSQTLRGTVVVDQHGAVDVTTSFLSSAQTQLPDAADVLTLNADTTVDPGAVFTGNGKLVNADGATLTLRDGAAVGVRLENAAILEIGNADTLASVTVGAFDQTVGDLNVDVGLAGRGAEADLLTVTTDATLQGTLAIGLLGGFTPALGEMYPILTAGGTVAGTFDTVLGASLGGGLMFDVVYQPQSVLLEVIEAILAGDYNASGLVEQGDLDLVLSNWGAGFASIPAAWVNQRPTTGIVDQAELDVVLTHWGATASPDLGGTSVPEPVLTGVLGAGLALRRRRGGRRRAPCGAG